MMHFLLPFLWAFRHPGSFSDHCGINCDGRIQSAFNKKPECWTSQNIVAFLGMKIRNSQLLLWSNFLLFCWYFLLDTEKTNITTETNQLLTQQPDLIASVQPLLDFPAIIKLKIYPTAESAFNFSFQRYRHSAQQKVSISFVPRVMTNFFKCCSNFRSYNSINAVTGSAS